MLLLTESTLFFINMMRTPSSDTNGKACVLSKVKQWTSRVKKEDQATSKPPMSTPSVGTMNPVPLSTVLSTPSTGVTSVEDKDCNAALDDEETYHGGFGEQSDDTLERAEALKATKDIKVSHVSHASDRRPLTNFVAARCRDHSPSTKAGLGYKSWTDLSETKGT